MNVLRAGRRLGAALAVGAAFAAAAVAAPAGAVTVRHAQGQTVIAAEPQKTVVFDLAALDIMQALGVRAAAVAGARFPDYLSDYAQDSYPKVGTLFEPDYEAVHAISPDLIVVGGRSGAKYGDLARLAPTIDLTVDANDLPGSVARNTRKLAAIYGKQEQAEAALGRLDDSIQVLREKAAKAGSGLVILTVGGKISAYGPGSRFGVIHDGFGVPAAMRDLATTTHGQAVSFEFIHKTNPEWLFVIDRDAAIGREGASARQLLDNELMHKTTAWRKNQIVYLDAMNWYLLGSAGLTALQQNVEQVSRALDGQQ
ncbi:siderophore ABC transporter substrate-binding protein [Pollutimonas bauzanensis]|nr:siderophore ABC transporter substrate-binding protein [Pollutimonas bauzanensis]